MATATSQGRRPPPPVRVEPYDGAQVTVRIRRLEPGEWRDLLLQHPPREQDVTPWNETSLPPALFAASVVEVDDGDGVREGIGAAEAQHWWDEWPEDAAESLLLACVRASSPHRLDWALRALRADARLALEASYCAEKGIDLAAFDAWSERGRDLVLAAWVASKDTCPGCSVPSWAMKDRDAADTDVITCVHCETRKQATDSIPEEARARAHVVTHLNRAGGR